MADHRKITKAVIPAAGFGTRMLPATKALPKEMLPVAAKPLIQYAIEEAAASGIETIILVTRSHKSVMQAHFSRDRDLESFLEGRQLTAAAELVRKLAGFADLRYVEQENPRGLAHAISCARPLVGEERFVVLLPDVIVVAGEPATRQLIRAHERHGGSVVAIREIELHEIERHGVVRVGDAAGAALHKSVRLTGLIEKPSLADAPSRFGVFGRYLLEPTIWDAIAKTDCDARGEVQLTDALDLLCRERPLYGFLFGGQHYDAGDRIGYLKANIELTLRDLDLQDPLRGYLSQLVC